MEPKNEPGVLQHIYWGMRYGKIVAGCETRKSWPEKPYWGWMTAYYDGWFCCLHVGWFYIGAQDY